MTDKNLADIFKALSNPNRLRIFLNIAGSEEYSFENVIDLSVKYDVNLLNDPVFICDLHNIFATIGAPTVSHHIKQLVKAKLITTEKRGKYLTARIDEETWGYVCEIINGLNKNGEHKQNKNT